jgi:hypothetical protein
LFSSPHLAIAGVPLIVIMLPHAGTAINNGCELFTMCAGDNLAITGRANE